MRVRLFLLWNVTFKGYSKTETKPKSCGAVTLYPQIQSSAAPNAGNIHSQFRKIHLVRAKEFFRPYKINLQQVFAVERDPAKNEGEKKYS